MWKKIETVIFFISNILYETMNILQYAYIFQNHEHFLMQILYNFLKIKSKFTIYEIPNYFK